VQVLECARLAPRALESPGRSFQTAWQHGDGPLHVVVQRPQGLIGRASPGQRVLAPEPNPSPVLDEYVTLMDRIQIDSLLSSQGNKFMCDRPRILKRIHFFCSFSPG